MEGTPGKPLGANTSEGVLANFFNSLLTKKTGGVSPGLVQSPATLGGGSPQPDTDCKFKKKTLNIKIFLIPSTEYKMSNFDLEINFQLFFELKSGLALDLNNF